MDKVVSHEVTAYYHLIFIQLFIVIELNLYLIDNVFIFNEPPFITLSVLLWLLFNLISLSATKHLHFITAKFGGSI